MAIFNRNNKFDNPEIMISICGSSFKAAIYRFKPSVDVGCVKLQDIIADKVF